SNITSNNNLFINDMNNSRALKAYNSILYSNNDCFVDNYDEYYGSSIWAKGADLVLVNATF
ncbi:MAG: hypothetical protein BZ135_09020, partial [Methanosphaera sp. rholeuAM6]